MGKKKKKVPKLTEEQYNAYIMSIKDNDTDGANGAFMPPVTRQEENKKD